MFPPDDGGPGRRSLPTARGDQVLVQGRNGSEIAGGTSSPSESFGRCRPRSTTPAPKPDGSNPFARSAIRASEVARCPEVLAVYHLPPAKPTRTTSVDRLVLAVLGYASRPMPRETVVARCAAWLGMTGRAVCASLDRLQAQGAVGDDGAIPSAYKRRARQQYGFFRFPRAIVEMVRTGTLTPLEAGTIALLPSRSKPGTAWADAQSHLATMLGANRSNVGLALRRLEELGLAAPGETHRLKTGHTLTAWSATHATEPRENATEPPLYATEPQSGTLLRRGQVPSVSTPTLRLVTSAEPEPEPAKPVETRAARKEAPAPAPESDNDRQRIVEDWTVRTVMTGIERLNPDDARHVAAVATLVYRLDPTSPPWFKNSRSTFARRLCRWAGHVEELGRWLVRVIQRRGPSNLLAYLRNASKAGDPGQVLRAELKNEMGRGAEAFEIFSRATEKALEGPHCAAVAKLVAGCAKVLEAEEPAERIRMRAELAAMLARGNLLAAGRVLRHAFRKVTPTDEKLVEFIGDACSLETARLALTA